MALVAVNNQQPIASYSSSLCVVDKVLKPGKTKLICSLAVLADPNPPVFWVVDVPGLVVMLCFEDKEGWDRPAHCVDTSDQSYPGWTLSGARRLSDAVTTLTDPPTPIWKPVSSKL